MKNTTQMLYGISPLELITMTYYEALIACKNGTKKQLCELMQYGFMDRDEPLILDINKAQSWCIAKLEEVQHVKISRFQRFAIHIKLAFKALLTEK